MIWSKNQFNLFENPFLSFKFRLQVEQGVEMATLAMAALIYSQSVEQEEGGGMGKYNAD